MRACSRAGLRAPEVAARRRRHPPRHRGLVMRHVAGETIARRILRDDEYAVARTVLVGELGRVPRRTARDRSRRGAGAESPDPMAIWDEVPAPRPAQRDVRPHPRVAARAPAAAHRRRADPRRPPARQRDRRRRRPRRGDRLGAHPPRRPARGPRLAVPEGVALRRAARGRRARHASTSWSRRTKRRVVVRRPRHVALVAGGEDASRGASAACCRPTSTCPAGSARSTSPRSVAAPPSRSGTSSSSSRPTRASRSAAPRRPPRSLPDDDRYGRPTARELLDAVREFLSERVATRDDRGLAYDGRVAANMLAIVERELAAAIDRTDGAGDDWDDARARRPRPPRRRQPEAPDAAPDPAGNPYRRGGTRRDRTDVRRLGGHVHRPDDPALHRRPVDDATLARCLEAATWAPSGANAQAWRFVVLRSPEARAAVAQARRRRSR